MPLRDVSLEAPLVRYGDTANLSPGHGHDDRGSLTKIPGVFDKLVQENSDPLDAVRTVVALVVGEGTD
jgi:hypothetical protein